MPQFRATFHSSEPPAPGTFEHSVLVGKLAFFTALGIPDNGIVGTPIRDLVPRNFRGKHVERRLEQLRVVPSGRVGRRRHLVLRHGPAPDETARRDVHQGTIRMTRASQLERRARQQH